MDIIKAREELLKGKTIYDMKLRVADYGRVSTDKDEQLNSLENQINYFKDYVKSNKNWTHVNSYIDEGISGTSTFKRENFLRMINDAKEDKIDLILTKEISRFSRNTIDSIKYTQELLKYGVIVLFLSDNINTIYPDSEFRLTLMASMAQDEIRKLSERVKFGIKRSIKEGKVGGSHLTGYYKKDGKLIINKKEEPIIKTLFNMYATNEYSFKQISNHLAELGYYTKKGKKYSDTTLKKMLTNPRYKGYYTANLSRISDYKTHKKELINKEEQIIYKDTKGNVPAIINEELWDLANNIYLKRKHKINLNKTNIINNKTYTSKLYCKEHNEPFIRCTTKRKQPVWQCNKYLRNGLKGCTSPIIKEEILNNTFIELINNKINFNTIKKELLNKYKNIKINSKQDNYNYIKENLISLLSRNIITEEEYIKEKNKINKELNKNNIKLNINKINKYLNNIELNNVFDIWINKVIISKVNNNRKIINLEIIYNYKTANEEKILYL